jgi:hypothetical protein
MKRRLAILLALPLLLLVAGCAPATHASLSAHPRATASHVPVKSASPTPSLPPVTTKPVVVPAVTTADYLVDGTPNVPDANGEWFGEWAFFTDSTKTVWCQFTVFSGDNPGATCSIVPADRSQVTYPKPAGSSADCSTSNWDGYTLALGGSADDLIPNADAGWDQCISGDAEIAGYMAKSKVLPNGAKIAFAPISCTTSNGVGTCTETDPANPTSSISITLGLHTASFVSTN